MENENNVAETNYVTEEFLIGLGFQKKPRSKAYYLRDITAVKHDKYFFFKYGGKDLPVSSNKTSIKQLVFGIYGW